MMSEKLILHSFRRCPFCIRTRMVLELKNIPHEIIEERLRDWTDWLIKNVPDPRVPIIRHGNKIIRESNMINEYLDSQFGRKEFTPEKDSPEYEKMKEWFIWCDEKLKPEIDLYKYGESADIRQNGLLKIQNYLDYLDGFLTNSKFILSEKLTLVDIAIVPFVRQIQRTRSGEFDFSLFPNVSRWAESIMSTSLFQDKVMKKYPFFKESS